MQEVKSQRRDLRVVTNGHRFKIQEGETRRDWLLRTRKVWVDLGSHWRPGDKFPLFMPNYYDTQGEAESVVAEIQEYAEKLHEWRQA